MPVMVSLLFLTNWVIWFETKISSEYLEEICISSEQKLVGF